MTLVCVCVYNMTESAGKVTVVTAIKCMELHEVAVQSALHLFCEALLHSATTNACVYMCRDRLPQKCFKVLIVGCETNHGRSGRHNHEHTLP